MRLFTGGCRSVIRMRRREGAFLEQDIRERLAELKRIHVELEALAPQVVQDYAAKMTSEFSHLYWMRMPVDEQRLATEIALFADRSNVDEELTRLKSHFGQCEAIASRQRACWPKAGLLDSRNESGSEHDRIEVESFGAYG